MSRLVLAVAAVAAAAVLGIVLGLVATGGSSEPKVTVPQVANMSTADAITTLLNNCKNPCFAIGTPSFQFNSLDPGIVIGTNPAAATVVSRGSSVALIVSRGPFKITCGLPCQVGILKNIDKLVLQQGQ